MYQGRTLPELARELDRQQALKRDYIIPSDRMAFSRTDTPHLECFDTGVDACFGTPTHSFSVTDLFHRQLGAALGIPAKYYDKMRAEAPALLADNTNHWLAARDSRHTIRTLNGDARAFLSDRYRRIDHLDILRAVLPVLHELDGSGVESCEVTDERMYLKVVNRRLEAEVVPGDIVQAGIMISNSEVGLGSVTVMPLVYRLVCRNGMTVNALGARKYHIGATNEETWELLSDNTRAADNTALLMKVADIVRTCVDEAKFAVVVGKLREAAGAKITGEVSRVVELTASNFGLVQSEGDAILQHLILGGDLSLLGLGNAVTRMSQDVGDYDRASRLETVGWEIVTMPPARWSAINA